MSWIYSERARVNEKMLNCNQESLNIADWFFIKIKFFIVFNYWGKKDIKNLTASLFNFIYITFAMIYIEFNSIL